jgi:hypothetical protein
MNHYVDTDLSTSQALRTVYLTVLPWGLSPTPLPKSVSIQDLPQGSLPDH